MFFTLFFTLKPSFTNHSGSFHHHQPPPPTDTEEETGEKLERIIRTRSATKRDERRQKRTSDGPFRKSESASKNKIFGAKLEDLQEGGQVIPPFIRKLIDHLKHHALHVTDLFATLPDESRLREFIVELENGPSSFLLSYFLLLPPSFPFLI